MAFGDCVRSKTIDATTSLDSRSFSNLVIPTLQVCIGIKVQEFFSSVILETTQDPGPDGKVSNTYFIPNHVLVVGQMLVKDIELALGLHGEAVNGIFNLQKTAAICVVVSAFPNTRTLPIIIASKQVLP